MKILFTSFAYYPETSGVPIVIQYLAEGLAYKGHSVSVATRVNGKHLSAHEVINGVNVYRFDIGQTLFKTDKGNVMEYIDFVMSFEKDILVLECLQCHTTDLLLPYLNKMNCKIVIHSHGIPGLTMKFFSWQGDVVHTIGNFHNWFRWKYYYGRTIPKYASSIDLGISLSLCSSDIGYFTDHFKHVSIVENAANSMFFDEKIKEDGKINLDIKSSRYILNISNYSDRKNQLLLLKEFVKADLKDCALVLIGSSPNKYYNKVVNAASKIRSKYKREIVILHGIDRKYFPSIIREASLFVMTSKWEEYPVSLVESMAIGTPFISTMVGNAHILPGGVVARTTNEIHILLKTLMFNNVLRDRLGCQGKKYAYEYNYLPKVIDIFENAITEL